MQHDTSKQYDEAVAQCRELFINKMKDYGPSWRILRPRSVTDQIFIKAKRIRTLELNGETKVGEGIWPEFIGIVNYGIIGLIQLRLGYSDTVDIDKNRALQLYDEFISATKELMMAKNTDYGEAWHTGERGHRRQLSGHDQLQCVCPHQAQRTTEQLVGSNQFLTPNF